ncbi:GNAT family N-acetyltransferase [Evansella tamaricis]|uniref:GNAT family N-acetyltransferase n=1 Tax=Evansella tamaricis TaxID=2069301 RepID=A0ABS6JCQ6_9BACI|nr:GNAT family N-acetyltransferase [Evansella tamaricis]MBU9711449.1 GNAT family N-acetyltransferase [Evansella tamaricis]
MGLITPFKMETKGLDIKIRPGNANDGKKMYTLTKEVIQEEDGLIMTVSDFVMTEEQQKIKNEAFLSHPDTLNLIAEHHDKIVGILTIEPEILKKTSHRAILGIIVQKNYRSKGIGKALIMAALNWVLHEGRYEKVELEVLASNKHAISLYHQLGFENEGMRYNAIKNSHTSYDHLVQMGVFTNKLAHTLHRF